jgi:hypothetical protein
MQTPTHSEWVQPIEELKEKRSQFTEVMSLAIREEAMRIRREEVEKHDRAHSLHSAPLTPDQRQEGWDG